MVIYINIDKILIYLTFAPKFRNMYKKQVMKRLINVILFFICIICSCSKDSEKEIIKLKNYTSDHDLRDEIRQAKEVLKHLYLPMEMSNMFKHINEDFDPSYLRTPSEGEKVVFSNEIALALGAFGVDLGYLRLYEQWNMSNIYFQTIKKISEKICLSDKVFMELSSYFDSPIYNKDTLEYLANEVYLITDYNLRQDGRDRTSALIILGGWLEAIKIGIEMYNSNQNEMVLKEICKQEKSLNSLVNLLAMQSDDDLLNNYLEQLQELQNLIHGLNAAYDHYETNQENDFSKETVNSYLEKIEKILKRMMDFAI